MPSLAVAGSPNTHACRDLHECPHATHQRVPLHMQSVKPAKRLGRQQSASVVLALGWWRRWGGGGNVEAHQHEPAPVR